MTHNNNQFDYLFKILIIGESGVGKTCLLLRYAEIRGVEQYVEISIE